MWLHAGRLPHVLPPRAYYDPDTYAREIDGLFANAWHCVTTTDVLRAAGDFVTLELFDEPVLVRNCDGEIRAFQNVCAHRHARLTAVPCGTSARMRCQYHGWEYDADGRTCRVPDARSFVPIRRGGERLHRFRAETCGKLVFVAIADGAPPLHAALGDATVRLIEQRFSRDFVPIGTWTIEHAANWKIIVENSLEGYHLTSVHPSTLAKLSRAEDCTHVLDSQFTRLENCVPPGGAGMRWVTEHWRRAPDRLYIHHHAFPSLMIPATDTWSMVQYVLPVSPTRSRSIVALYGHRGDGERWWHRVTGPVLRAVLERYIHRIQREDNAMFPNVQRGLCASQQAGVLGAREERIHAFQTYIAGALAERRQLREV